jgi:thiamine-monophosphate kinase
LDVNRVGEFGLIDLIAKDTIFDPASVVVGIGDDAAALLPAPDKIQLVTTDMLVETVHFDLTTTTAYQLGHKAIAVNLSDIAAMGGIPRHALISIALPKKINVDFVLELYKGMKEICRDFKVNIVGGDTVSSPDNLVLNVVVIGEAEPSRLIKRSGAKPGDIVAVTGPLGGSAAGLEILTAGLTKSFPFSKILTDAHLTPMPKVSLGRALANAGATSMDDISDGLASECHEIAAASQVGIELYADAINVSEETIIVAEYFNKPPLDYALYGGEDFELLFTMPPDIFANIMKTEPASISQIGRVVKNEQSVVLIWPDGTKEKIEAKGYNHFRD